MKTKEIEFKAKVRIAKMRRNIEVSSGKANVEMVENMKALNPNPARGKPVAVPRLSG